MDYGMLWAELSTKVKHSIVKLILSLRTTCAPILYLCIFVQYLLIFYDILFTPGWLHLVPQMPCVFPPSRLTWGLFSARIVSNRVRLHSYALKWNVKVQSHPQKRSSRQVGEKTLSFGVERWEGRRCGTNISCCVIHLHLRQVLVKFNCGDVWTFWERCDYSIDILCFNHFGPSVWRPFNPRAKSGILATNPAVWRKTRHDRRHQDG